MRALKALVIVMGVIIVVGVAVVGVTIFNRLSRSAPLIAPVATITPSATPPAASSPAPGSPPANAALGVPLPQPVERKFGNVNVAVPAGARVADFSASGDRVVLRVVLPNQEQQLMVVDLLDGALLGTIRLTANGATSPTNPGLSNNGAGLGLLMPLPQVNVPPRNKSEGLK